MNRVFISWSGDRSRMLAEALRDWLPTAVQAAKPWVSSGDIGAGGDWLASIRGELQEAKCGILCVTRDNLAAPWLLFEAGALAKHLGSPVCVLLLDLRPSDVAGPLSIFQSSQADKAGMHRILKTVNVSMEHQLDDATLANVLKMAWPHIEGKIKAIPEMQRAEKPPLRTERELLEEVLSVVRSTNTPSDDSLHASADAQPSRLSPEIFGPYIDARDAATVSVGWVMESPVGPIEIRGKRERSKGSRWHFWSRYQDDPTWNRTDTTMDRIAKAESILKRKEAEGSR